MSEAWDGYLVGNLAGDLAGDFAGDLAGVLTGVLIGELDFLGPQTVFLSGFPSSISSRMSH